MTEYFAVIEAGGTKFNCAIMNAEREIFSETRIATTTPEETLRNVVDFFQEQKAKGFGFEKLGLGTFGPVDLDPKSKHYGYITATPKPHWSFTPITQTLESELDCEVTIDTDVNAAALGEYRWGAAQGCNVCVYVTVGTGVGGGVIIDGKPLHGLIHPEIGHMLIGEVDNVAGVCPFHGNCVEGLASGTAMGKIWKTPAETLDDNHPAWDLEAKVLSKMCHNLLMTLSPQKIILGGGVMSKPGLLPKVVSYTEQSLKDYLCLPAETSLADIIRETGLGQRSGLFGSLALVI